MSTLCAALTHRKAVLALGGILNVFHFLSPFSAFATTFINRPLGVVVKESPYIVRGRAGDSYSDWGKGEQRAIFTYTNFTITEVLKGNLSETKIVLRQPGGAKDGMEMMVPGTAHFSGDDDVVVLLGDKNADDGSYDVPGFATGKYNVVRSDNGELVLENSMGGAAMYDPGKDPNTLSYNAKIPLEAFRKVAQGQNVPEASGNQYERSSKPAPKGAIDDHDHRLPLATAQPQSSPNTNAALVPPAKEEKGSLWIPLSFVLILAAAGFLFWRMLSKGGPSA